MLIYGLSALRAILVRTNSASCKNVAHSIFCKQLVFGRFYHLPWFLLTLSTLLGQMVMNFVYGWSNKIRLWFLITCTKNSTMEKKTKEKPYSSRQQCVKKKLHKFRINHENLRGICWIEMVGSHLSGKCCEYNVKLLISLAVYEVKSGRKQFR